MLHLPQDNPKRTNDSEQIFKLLKVHIQNNQTVLVQQNKSDRQSDSKERAVREMPKCAPLPKNLVGRIGINLNELPWPTIEANNPVWTLTSIL